MWSHLTVALSAVYISSAASYSSYDQDNAFNALYYAYGAYCDASELTAWDCKWCNYVNFEVASVITGNSLQAFAGYDTEYDQIVLSYRGTANIDDWVKDFEFDHTTYPYSDSGDDAIHSGFYGSYQDLGSDGITSALFNLFSEHPYSDILVTGHSLGAAIAQIAAMDLRLNTAQYGAYSIGAINVITFGSPRWAREALVDVYESTVDSNWRIVNEDDIVPTVPYEWQGYHHSATEIRYTDDSSLTYTQCDGSGEDDSCYYVGTSVDDHLNYLNLYESCDTSSESYIDIDALDLLFPSTTKDTDGMLSTMDQETETTMNQDIETTNIETTTITNAATTDFEDQIIVKWKEGLDSVSKIALSIAVAVGWLCALICCLCYCRARAKLNKAQGTNGYFQFHEV